jgi:hypothetical protein
MEENLEKRALKDFLLTVQEAASMNRNKCPLYNECACIYGCPDNFEDCDEYNPDQRLGG